MKHEKYHVFAYGFIGLVQGDTWLHLLTPTGKLHSWDPYPLFHTPILYLDRHFYQLGLVQRQQQVIFRLF